MINLLKIVINKKINLRKINLIENPVTNKYFHS